MNAKISKLVSLFLAMLMLGISVGCNNSAEKVNSEDSNKTSNESINDAELEKLRGTTVKFATWRNPETDEDGPVIKSFQEKYGIKVEIVTVPQDTYIMDLSGKIASGDSPDIYFCNADFPGCLTVLQPLEAAGLDFSDPIWDQSMIKLSTVGGKPYLVNTVGNIWNEVDCVYYNKKLLENNNITTPEEYYEQGKWTFDAMTKVMTSVKNLGSKYIGGYFKVESLVGSTGTNFYNWKDGEFSNGINDDLTNVMKYISNSIKNGLVKGTSNENRDEFINGNVGIAVTNAFGLKKTGYWSRMNPSSIGFTFIPDYDETHKAVSTGIFRGWGLIKGAKNPKAAGLFLRYYLDVNNYDTATSFISEEAETFFFKLTGIDTAEKNPYMFVGIENVTGTPNQNYLDIAKADPNQVSQQLSSISNVVDSNVKILNSAINKKVAEN